MDRAEKWRHRAKAVGLSPLRRTGSRQSDHASLRGIKVQKKPELVYAERGHARIQALRMVWPIVCRRLEGLPNISAIQLFDELCIPFPGRFTPRQYPALLRRVNRWRKDARGRGVVIGSKTYRRFSDKPRGRPRDIFKNHWTEMLECLEAQPDQTALELLGEFRARYPEQYSLRNLSALQRRVKTWRREAVQRLMMSVKENFGNADVDKSMG
jgi:hypothetical protein